MPCRDLARPIDRSTKPIRVLFIRIPYESLIPTIPSKIQTSRTTAPRWSAVVLHFQATMERSPASGKHDVDAYRRFAPPPLGQVIDPSQTTRCAVIPARYSLSNLTLPIDQGRAHSMKIIAYDNFKDGITLDDLRP